MYKKRECETITVTFRERLRASWSHIPVAYTRSILFSRITFISRCHSSQHLLRPYSELPAEPYRTALINHIPCRRRSFVSCEIRHDLILQAFRGLISQGRCDIINLGKLGFRSFACICTLCTVTFILIDYHFRTVEFLSSKSKFLRKRMRSSK